MILRPNIHIFDTIRAYEFLINAPKSKVSGEIFNAGYENQKVKEIAEAVKLVIGDDVCLITSPTNDDRSYHISSKKIKNILGFEAKKSISDAVRDLKEAFDKGLLPDSFENELYFNIKRMQSISLF